MADGLKIVTVGTFKILDAAGRDLTPRGRKACGLLALVALAPHKRRSRLIAQDKLWSGRGPEQSAASLRQTLSEIRRALGDQRHCLFTDTRVIALDTTRVSVDLDDDATMADLAGRAELPVLLEGLDVRDTAFQQWLTDQRAAFDRRHHRRPAETVAASLPGAPLVSPGLVLRAASARPWVRLLPPTASTGDSARFLAHLVGDAIAKCLREAGGVDIAAEADGAGPGLVIAAEAAHLGQHVSVRIDIRAAETGVQVWSDACTIAVDAPFLADSIDLKALVHRAFIAAGRQLRRLSEAPVSANPSAYDLSFDALEHLFSLKEGTVQQADAMLAAAFEASSSATLLAWRGYARTFLLGEAATCDWQAIAGEADAFTRQALERDPDNSTVLALASYVQSFAMRNYAAGCDLAEKSLLANPHNPLGLAFLGRAHAYLGNNAIGYAYTRQALQVVGNSPFTYTLCFLGGITALLDGHHAEAARLAEIARGLAPAFRAPQRYLVPLYLKTGQPDRAREALQRMHRLEPDFSLNTLRERSYPSTGLRQSGLLDLSDRELAGLDA